MRSRGEMIFDRCNIAFLALVGLSAIYPFVYMLTLSVSTLADVAQGGALVIPHEISWAAYDMVFRDEDIRNGFINTTLRTALGTAATLLMTALVAYPLSRPYLPLRRQIVFYIIFTMLFTGGLVPRYLLIKHLGLIDSIWALVLPIMLSAFNVIVLKNFFQQIPPSYEEAAKMDGAGDWSVLFRIYLPLSKPALTAYGVITALSAWNMYLWPLIVIQSKELRPLTLVIAQFSSQMNAELHILMACVTLSLLPIFLLYLFGQRFFVEGVTMSGIKG